MYSARSAESRDRQFVDRRSARIPRALDVKAGCRDVAHPRAHLRDERGRPQRIEPPARHADELIRPDVSDEAEKKKPVSRNGVVVWFCVTPIGNPLCTVTTVVTDQPPSTAPSPGTFRVGATTSLC